MSKTVTQRSAKDRLRYSIALEIGLLVLLVPAGAAFFDKGLADIGLLGLVLSLKAVLVGLLYNWVFDCLDANTGRVSSDERLLAGSCTLWDSS